MLSRSSKRTGSNPIDCAAASRRRSRSSSSSGGSGGGAEISITSENMNWVGGGGGRIFLLLLRCRENGNAIPEERSKLPRARLGAPFRGLCCGEDGDEGDMEDDAAGAPEASYVTNDAEPEGCAVNGSENIVSQRRGKTYKNVGARRWDGDGAAWKRTTPGQFAESNDVRQMTSVFWLREDRRAAHEEHCVGGNIALSGAEQESRTGQRNTASFDMHAAGRTSPGVWTRVRALRWKVEERRRRETYQERYRWPS